MFHFDPATGHVAPCRATKRPCPYGEAAHRESEAQARQAYEATMGPEATPMALSKNELKKTRLRLQEDLAEAKGALTAALTLHGIAARSNALHKEAGRKQAVKTTAAAMERYAEEVKTARRRKRQAARSLAAHRRDRAMARTSIIEEEATQ